MQPVPIVVVVGATASGKSALALNLAQRIGGEIVNTDAMQVYRGMDVGTAKVSPAEQALVPHHLLDLLDPTEPLSVAEFQGWARQRIADLRVRGTVPVLVGGSALYVRAIIDQFDFPGTDPGVRARLEGELGQDGAAPLYARLQGLDPEAAANILPENGRRIVRALEVIEVTGRPFTASLPVKAYADPYTIQIGVDIDRETLAPRILRRVEQMYEGGLLEEVAGLLVKYNLGSWAELGRTAATAIGYREAAAHLAGELTREEAVTATATATRRFARRQDQWFRKDDRVRWLPWDAEDLTEQAETAIRGEWGYQ